MELIVTLGVLTILLALVFLEKSRDHAEEQRVANLESDLQAWVGAEYPPDWYVVSRVNRTALCIRGDLMEFVLCSGDAASLQRFPAAHLRRAELLANEATSISAVGIDLGLGVGVGSASVVKRIDALKVRLHLRDAAHPFFDIDVFKPNTGIQTSDPKWKVIETQMACHLSRLEMLIENGAT